MQFTSYYNNPSEQALLTLQVREAELRVAREELAFLQACGGVGEEDVRRLRLGLGLQVVKGEDVVVVVKEERDMELVSLKSVLLPLLKAENSITQLCRRVNSALAMRGVRVFKRHKTAHVRQSDAGRVLEMGREVLG